MGATARTARRLPRWLAGIAWILAVAAASGSGGEDELEDDVFTGVVLELDEEEGVAYARALRPEGEDGWMELWQEGHRLMANTTELELSIGVRGVDTYLWASLYDGAGRWIAQSNVLHTGHQPGVEVRISPDFSARRWEEGAPLEVPFELALVPGADAAAADTAIVLIDNQTTGMLQLHAALERGAAPAAFRYAHSGQVEVGRHTLSLAVLAPGAATPAAFSAQVTFQVDPAPLDVQSYTAGWPWGAAASPPDPAPRACAPALRACFARAARRVPPNRQYTELEDAADACASQHCAGAAPGGAALAAAARAPLLALLDEAGSALAAGRPAGEALLRAGQALAALRAPALAARAYRAALRVVGRADAPLPRRQCTYPGCNEMGKDACNLLQRAEIEAEAGAAEAGAEAEGAVYARHLRHLLPAADAGAAAGGGAAAAPDGGRYSVGDVVFGCLTTVSSYGTRAAAVRDTWRRRATHFHFYGDAPDAALPVTPFGALAGGTLGREGAFLQAQVARADYASSLAKFFLALLDMHARHPRASWFFLCGDDNFVVPDNLLALLQPLDAREPLLVGGPLGSHVGVGRYLSGGSGIVFSQGFLARAARHLAPFAASWRRERGRAMLCHPCADVAFGVLAKDLGARLVEVGCMHGMWPEYFALHSVAPAVRACAPRRSTAGWPRVRCARPATFHYVQPRAMRLLAAALLGPAPAPNASAPGG